MTVSQAIQRRLTIVRIACATFPRNLNEAEGHKLTDAGAYRVTMNAELDKVVERARQPAVSSGLPPWR